MKKELQFQERLTHLLNVHETLINQINPPIYPDNGIYTRFEHPVLTANHIPLHWKYDLHPQTNPFLMERMGVNGVFNAGAIKWNGKYRLLLRVEGVDRKSFFAWAESTSPVDRFRIIDEPLLLPDYAKYGQADETNAYDMRLTEHQDGWIYGIYCAERKDPSAKPEDTVSALASAAIVRTKDLMTWYRLPDLQTTSPQQRNVVLHPEFYQGKYLLYTRPQDGFIDAGTGGGICWGLSDTMENPRVEEEQLLDERVYHTIKEVKNGAGAPPIRTPQGWLHLVHGVRNTAAGLRYVIYCFLTDLTDPVKVIARPGGHLIAPQGYERVGDVSNVVFINGAITDSDGKLYLYYASSDTRMHVAQTSLDKMVDYCRNTPPDGVTSRNCVQQRLDLIRRNRQF